MANKTDIASKKLEALLTSRHQIFYISALFFVFLGLAIFFVYNNARRMRDIVNRDFNRQQLILARQAGEQINGHLQDIFSEINILRSDLPQIWCADIYDEALKSVYERTHHKGVIEVGLLDHSLNKRFHITSPDYRPAEAESIADCIRNTSLPGSKLCCKEVESDRSGKVYISCGTCSEIVFNGTETGILYAVINVSYLIEQSVKNIDSGVDDRAWVIDKDGLALYHPELELTGAGLIPLKADNKTRNQCESFDSTLVNNLMSGLESAGAGYFFWDREGEESNLRLYAHTPIRNPSFRAGEFWNVVVEAPYSETSLEIGSIYSGQVLIVGAILSGMFFFSLVIFLYQRSISTQLRQRVDRQKTYISSILQNSVDGIVFIDNENRIQVWNKGAEMIFGYTDKEMIGQSFHRLVPAEIDAEAELKKIWDEVLIKGYVRNFVSKRETKAGKIITVDISRTLVKSPEGDVLGSTAIIKDITKHAEMERRIYNTEKLASIGTLAAGVAHEINNPLGVILGFTELLIDRYDPGTQEYEDLKVIEENGLNAKRIVEDLLGFARVSEGMDETVDVKKSLETVLKIVKSTLTSKKIEWTLRAPDTLPRTHGDSREFQQVIVNLINNSLSAIDDRGGKINITAVKVAGSVETSVTDTGSGIPNKIKALIFDPFFTTKEVDEGTGLGLSLCYGIVKKYGGNITFHSVCKDDFPDQPCWTTFTVSLPAVEKTYIKRRRRN